MMIESHSVCPLHCALPTMQASNFWNDASRATERDTTSALEPSPFNETR